MKPNYWELHTPRMDIVKGLRAMTTLQYQRKQRLTLAEKFRFSDGTDFAQRLSLLGFTKGAPGKGFT